MHALILLIQKRKNVYIILIGGEHFHFRLNAQRQ